jgi:micrococcal nuclease
MKSKQRLTAAVLVVCLVLAGCGGGANTQSSPTATETQTATPDGERTATDGEETKTDRETTSETQATATDGEGTKTGEGTDGETTEAGGETTSSDQTTDARTGPADTGGNETVENDTGTDTQPCKQSPSGVETAIPDCEDTQTQPETETETQTETEMPETETGTDTPSDERGNETTVESPIDGGTAQKAVVTRVIDGDTVEVRFTNGEVDTIRLIGVDTPETSLSNQDLSEYGIPDTPSGSDWLLMWGENAESFANDALAGTTVLVVSDPKSDTRGYYGRLLAYIYSDGKNFGHTLLEKGYARVYTGAEFTLENEYIQIESNAQNANRGLWAYDEEHTTPSPTTTPAPTETSSEVMTPPLPADGDYDCSHFDTQAQAQAVFDDHAEDIYRLDGDGDGRACESLP